MWDRPARRPSAASCVVLPMSSSCRLRIFDVDGIVVEGRGHLAKAGDFARAGARGVARIGKERDDLRGFFGRAGGKGQRVRGGRRGVARNGDGPGLVAPYLAFRQTVARQQGAQGDQGRRAGRRRLRRLSPSRPRPPPKRLRVSPRPRAQKLPKHRSFSCRRPSRPPSPVVWPGRIDQLWAAAANLADYARAASKSVSAIQNARTPLKQDFVKSKKIVKNAGSETMRLMEFPIHTINWRNAHYNCSGSRSNKICFAQGS